MFDLDDLAEENFLVLCIKANPEEGIEDDVLHIWKGPDFNEEDDVDNFISEVIVKYWGDESINVKRIE